MIAWLWNWIVGRFCSHQWEIHEEIVITAEDGVPTGRLYVLRCVKCGDVSSKKCGGYWL
jgi:hypothetical protein